MTRQVGKGDKHNGGRLEVPIDRDLTRRRVTARTRRSIGANRRGRRCSAHRCGSSGGAPGARRRTNGCSPFFVRSAKGGRDAPTCAVRQIQGPARRGARAGTPVPASGWPGRNVLYTVHDDRHADRQQLAAPHETPEHNALQVLFTDDAWVVAFVWAYLARRGERTAWRARCATRTTRVVRACGAGQESGQLPGREPRDVGAAARRRVPAQVGRVREQYAGRVAWLTSRPVPYMVIEESGYEQKGADVELDAYVGIEEGDVPKGVCFVLSSGRGLGAPGRRLHLRIECKPTLGDDYPAVLRQMLANRSNVLLIGRGEDQGVGATFDQVQKMFGASSITVMCEHDIPWGGEA